MKCIGRECIYNKGNHGNYCGLPDSFFTKEGWTCILEEKLTELYKKKSELEDEISTMEEWKKNILKLQK